jgi:integrase
LTNVLIGSYEATIYKEDGGYRGAVSLGNGPDGKRKRITRRAKTKAAVKDKLADAISDLEAGLKGPATYTVEEAIEDWFSRGLKKVGSGTITNYRSLATNHAIPRIGKANLRELVADDVDDWLEAIAEGLSSRSLRLVHSILKRSIRHAQRRDRVLRNVAELVDPPKGKKPGRPSKALTSDQARTILEKAESSRLHAYVVVSLLTGIRTEEARELRWDHVVAWVNEELGWRPVTEVGFDHERLAIYVWRSVREDGDTKTEKSRRTLELPKRAVEALRRHHKRQAAQKLRAGEEWENSDLVFCTPTGKPLDAANVRRAFRLITKKAGLGVAWTPRELRHSFVSIMSDRDVPIECIADLCGHASPDVTGRVYRHQLKPVITKGAGVINEVFGESKSA